LPNSEASSLASTTANLVSLCSGVAGNACRILPLLSILLKVKPYMWVIDR
jgi:hypothetical protein